jgi:hypothetical protein
VSRPFSFADPLDTSPSRRVREAMSTLTDAGARLREITRGHAAAVQAIRGDVSQNPDLTAEGRANELRRRTTAANEAASAEVAALKDQIERAERTIEQTIEAAWPRPASGVEGMLGRQAAWARAQSLLTAGVKVNDLIAEADQTEDLYALREELPTYVRARGGNADTVRTVRERIDLRMAQIAGKTAEVELMARHEARVILATLKPLLEHAEAVALGHVEHGNGLHAAIASAMATRTAATAQRPILDPSGNVL